MNPKIRSAERADVPNILALIQALADYEQLSDHAVGTAAALEEHLFGPSPCIEALIAEVEETPIGFALYFPSYSTFTTRPGFYLEDLFVRSEYRGSGVGKALLNGLIDRAKQQHCGHLSWSVLDWNTPAIEFYQRIGATVFEDVRICRLTENALTSLAAQSAGSARFVQPADSEALYDLIKALAECDQSLDQFTGSVDQLQQHLFSPVYAVEAAVADREQTIAGGAVFFTNYSTFLTKPGLYIEDLFVLPQFRRQGIGQALLTFVAQQALQRQCGRVEWLVRTWNHNAIAFYERLGAEVLPDWRICRLPL